MALPLASPHRVRKNRLRWRWAASGRRDYNYFRDYDSGTGRYAESDPLGLFAGVSTYAYAWANPLSFADPFGLSAADAIAITKSIEQSIDQMVKDGHRLPGTGGFNGWLNNQKRWWTNWGDHAKYHQWDCYDQTNYVNDQLKKLKLDDKWDILTVTQPGHATGAALSENPSDPMISYDSWRGTIVIDPSNNP
jgi:RHS repeat-associated protein